MDERNHPPQPETVDEPLKATRNPLQRFESHVLRRVVSGLLVLIPLLVTLLILRFVVIYVDDIFRGEGGFFAPLIDETALDFPGVGIIFLLVVLYVVGLLVAGRFGRTAVDWQSAVLSRIPVVKSIYSVAKQVTDTLASPSDNHFSRVVFVEWPRPGYLALGFVTGQCHSPVEERMLLVVYVPTVPNPTSGNLAFVSEEDIVETDMSVEDAMKLVFSGGIVLPDALGLRSKTSLSVPPRN